MHGLLKLKAGSDAARLHVQVQSPMHVTTKMSKIRRASSSVPTPQTYCSAAVRHVGYEPAAVPYMWHALEAYATSLWARNILLPVMSAASCVTVV